MWRLVICILGVFVFSGCASIFNDTKQVINVDSDPKGALVKSNDLHRTATTPTAFTIQKGPLKDINVRLEQEGYVPQEVVLNRRITPSYWVNILNGYGFIIDFLTGAMWNYQDSVYIKLEPLPSHSQVTSE